MTRDDHLAEANAALTEASKLATTAQYLARAPGVRDEAVPLAAVGALWVDIARTHAAIAATLPETTDIEETEKTDA